MGDKFNFQQVKKPPSIHKQKEAKILKLGVLLAGQYKLLQKIGQGSFGQIWLTQDCESEEFLVTKLEKRDERQGAISLLQREIKVLTEIKGIIGFPEIMFYGKDTHYNFCMTTYLGPDLEQVFKKCNSKFSMTTVLSIALQMIDRMEVFHSKNFIHRDIKPENFVIGREDISLIYLIDFGLSKYYRNEEGKHIDYISKKGMIGTARYASINALQEMEQSRRDDLESIGYLLIYLAKGSLPWMNIKAATKSEKYEKILNFKNSYSLASLCKDLPKCFLNFFQHIKSLLFQQQPNYSYLRGLFQESLSFYERKNFAQVYDWENLQEMQGVEPQVEANIRLDTVPAIEEEGKISSLRQIDQQKFMKGLHEKFEIKQIDNTREIKIESEKNNENKTLLPSSKYNNYKTLMRKETNKAFYIQIKDTEEDREPRKKDSMGRRKDSKSLTVANRKDSRASRKRSSIDADIADDDDAHLNFNNLQIKSNIKSHKHIDY